MNALSAIIQLPLLPFPFISDHRAMKKTSLSILRVVHDQTMLFRRCLSVTGSAGLVLRLADLMAGLDAEHTWLF